MYIAILGRQPELGMAELERLYSNKTTQWFSDTTALIHASSFFIDQLGGSQKAGRVVKEMPIADWRHISDTIVQIYLKEWSRKESKITLGISAYGFDVKPSEVQKTGIVLKQKLKKHGVNLRLLPNKEPALNTATSHHNKLGLAPNKVELIIVKGSKTSIIAQSIGAQNITSYTQRDRERPKRDAFVGMLPPKLAQIMINLARPKLAGGRILDPFCGTGVILQEAALMGYKAYGTDLSDKMIGYTNNNLQWLQERQHSTFEVYTHQADAMSASWQSPIDAVVSEAYLGQPFSAHPSPSKLDQVRKNCDHIIETFLRNLATYLSQNTPVCIAIPAWRDQEGHFTYLTVLKKVHTLGYRPVELHHVVADKLLYFREDQVVARHLLILEKA